MSRTTEKIQRMLSNEQETELSKMKMNVVRALAVYKGVSWKTELFLDLVKLLQFLGQPDIIEPRILDKALDSLASDGIISVEDRTRGAMLKKGICKDQLLRLNDLVDVRSVLEKDPVFAQYMHSRDKMIRDALSNWI